MKLNHLTYAAFLAGLLGGALVFWLVIYIIGFKPSGAQPAYSSLSMDENLSSIEFAYSVARALNNDDYDTIAKLIEPAGVVTLVPFSTVDFDNNLSFNESQIKAVKNDKTVYIWGKRPEGSVIESTASDFFKEFFKSRDFSCAPIPGVNRVVRTGNALENVSEAFPDASFVDLCYPPTADSSDWVSLKVVFRRGDNDSYNLVALIHGESTKQ